MDGYLRWDPSDCSAMDERSIYPNPMYTILGAVIFGSRRFYGDSTKKRRSKAIGSYLAILRLTGYQLGMIRPFDTF
jgi:hypothetical protein